MPAPAPSVEIFDTLHELLRIFRARMRQHLAAAHPDLSFGALRVLMQVGAHPGCAQKTLVERSHIDKAQMARLLSQLQDKGWLLRSESAQDRRVRELRLSAAGQHLFRQLAAQRAALAAELLQGCPPAQQVQLQQLLAQALGSARGAVQGDGPGSAP